jgi:DNA-binding ferritin-like protein
MENDLNLTEELKKELKRRNILEQEDEDQDVEETSNGSKQNKDFNEMISKLLHSQTQVHVFHLGAKGNGSYAAHKALQGYYVGIDGLVDGVVESYQGKYGLITNYDTYKMEKFDSVKTCISYFNTLNDMITDKRKSVEDSFIQNQIDTVQELLFSTVYKLKFLS